MPVSVKINRAKSDRSNRQHRGSKTTKIIRLLKRPSGASLKELQKVTGWQAHSLRGFLSGTVRKKLGLSLASVVGKDGRKRYRIENGAVAE